MKYGVAIQGPSPESLISVRVIHIGKESLLVHTLTLAIKESLSIHYIRAYGIESIPFGLVRKVVKSVYEDLFLFIFL